MAIGFIVNFIMEEGLRREIADKGIYGSLAGDRANIKPR